MKKPAAQAQSVQYREKIKPIRQMVRLRLGAMQNNKRQRGKKNTFISQNKRDSHPNIWQAADPPAETTEGGVNCLIRCWGRGQEVLAGGQRGISCVLCSSIRTNNREQASCAPCPVGDKHTSFLLPRKSAAHSHYSDSAHKVIDRPHHSRLSTLMGSSLPDLVLIFLFLKWRNVKAIFSFAVL